MADVLAWIGAHLETVEPSQPERPNAAAASSQVRQPT
jgi:hypothetical protein